MSIFGVIPLKQPEPQPQSPDYSDLLDTIGENLDTVAENLAEINSTLSAILDHLEKQSPKE